MRGRRDICGCSRCTCAVGRTYRVGSGAGAGALSAGDVGAGARSRPVCTAGMDGAGDEPAEDTLVRFTGRFEVPFEPYAGTCTRGRRLGAECWSTMWRWDGKVGLTRMGSRCVSTAM